MKKKWAIWVLALIIVAGGGAYYYRQQTQAAAAKKTTQSTLTAKVTKGTVESTLSGTASIVYADRRTLQSTVDGTMTKVYVKDGATVKEGDLLAAITNQTILDDVETARMDLENQQLKLETYKTVTPSDKATVLNSLRQADENLDNKKKDVEKLTVKSPLEGRVSTVAVRLGQTVSANQTLFTVSEDSNVLVVAQVKQSDIAKIGIGQSATIAFGTELPTAAGTVTFIGVQASAGTTTSNTTVPVNIKIDNSKGIYRTGLIANVLFPHKDYNGAEDNVAATGSIAALSTYEVKAEVAGTVDTINVSQGSSVLAGQLAVTLKSDSIVRAVEYAQNSLTIAQETYDRVQKGYAPNTSDADLKTAEFAIKQSETKLRTKLEKAADLQIRSPIDGVVLSHNYDETASITAGNTLFVIADPNQMQMVVPVDELDVMQVKTGQKATITVDALPGQTFSGTVSKIGSEGSVKDGIATYSVTVTVDLPKNLKGSMTGTASITIAKKEGVLNVPTEAIKSSGTQKYVVLVKNGVTQNANVTVGISSKKAVEILTGLQEGDSVAISTKTTTTTQQGGIPGIGGMGGPQGGR
jgi:HlyD family secretion protein